MTDPIADMLTRIRNAIAAKHPRVDIPGSKLKMEVARILKDEGYINNFSTKGEGVKVHDPCLSSLRCKGTVVDHAPLTRVASGPASLCRIRRDPESFGRIRREYRFDVKRADERQTRVALNMSAARSSLRSIKVELCHE